MGERGDRENPLDNTGQWHPPRELGHNQILRCHSTGVVFCCDGERIVAVRELPAEAALYYTYSIYHHTSVFWIVPFDATMHQVGDVHEGSDDRSDFTAWRRMGFHYALNHVSSATIAGEHHRLSGQRRDQTWVQTLLPESYQSAGQYLPNGSGYGGLAGELPIILALIAYSVYEENVAWLMQRSLQQGVWIDHNRTVQHGREFVTMRQFRPAIADVLCVQDMTVEEWSSRHGSGPLILRGTTWIPSWMATVHTVSYFVDWNRHPT